MNENLDTQNDIIESELLFDERVVATTQKLSSNDCNCDCGDGCGSDGGNSDCY